MGNEVDQTPSIVVPASGQLFRGRAVLHDHAKIQNDDKIPDITKDGRVVGVERTGYVTSLLEALKEVEDLSLHRGIAARDPLITNESVPLHGQGATGGARCCSPLQCVEGRRSA